MYCEDLDRPCVGEMPKRTTRGLGFMVQPITSLIVLNIADQYSDSRGQVRNI